MRLQFCSFAVMYNMNTSFNNRIMYLWLLFYRIIIIPKDIVVYLYRVGCFIRIRNRKQKLENENKSKNNYEVLKKLIMESEAKHTIELKLIEKEVSDVCKQLSTNYQSTTAMCTDNQSPPNGNSDTRDVNNPIMEQKQSKSENAKTIVIVEPGSTITTYNIYENN